MTPFEVNPGELPAIGAAMIAQEASKAAFLQSVAPHAVPLPSVACAPGFYMTAGFAVVDAVLSSYLATDIAQCEAGATSRAHFGHLREHRCGRQCRCVGRRQFCCHIGARRLTGNQLGAGMLCRSSNISPWSRSRIEI